MEILHTGLAHMSRARRDQARAGPGALPALPRQQLHALDGMVEESPALG